MRGGYMNGKYPSGGRGGSSFRGGRHGPPPPRQSHSGSYYDPYYNSSPPSRGGRGSYRGGSGWPSRGGRGGYYSSPVSSYRSPLPNGGAPGSGSGSGPISESAMTPGSHMEDDSGNNHPSTPVPVERVNLNHESAETEIYTPRQEAQSKYNQGGDFNNDNYWNNGYSSRGRGGSNSRFTGRGGRVERGHETRYSNSNGEYTESQYHNMDERSYGKSYYGNNGRYEDESFRPLSRPRSAGYSNPTLNDKFAGENNSRAPTTTPQRSISYEEKARLEAEERKKKEESLLREELEKKKEVEFRQKHWISRIHARDPIKTNLAKLFDELDTVNRNLLDIGAKRVALEIDVARHARIFKAEEDRVHLADEKLEAMNLSFSL